MADKFHAAVAKVKDGATKIKQADKENWKQAMFGSYSYAYLCTPKWPFCRGKGKKREESPFFGLNANLGFITALVMGFQHALAMTAGLITPPLIIGFKCPAPPYGDDLTCTTQRTYLIQAAMLVCGISTAIQVTGFRFGPIHWGSGILSVMGVSFTSVSIWTGAIGAMMDQGDSFATAYGRMLGTTAFCAVTPMIISFFPFSWLRRIFPPIVTSSTIMLIGINLTGAGFQNWGGGATCVDGGLCSGNGNVALPFGNGAYVGLGFLVFALIIIFEIFGSPFVRNGAVFLALLCGYAFAAIVPSFANGEKHHFVNTDSIDTAPVATFLWTTTYSLKVYTPAILPMIIVFIITSIECIGDTSATCEASNLPTMGQELMDRIKGALFNDSVTSIFSSLAMSMPLTTFAQNNGVIALTNVAARQAGWACAFWLLLLGIFAKFGGWVLSIPNCVLGGMTSFLFANVIASGIKILICAGPLRRRERFILACGLTLGIGVTLVPQWPANDLWPPYDDPNSAGAVFRASVLAVLESGFCLCAVTTVILNLIIPFEEESATPAEDTEVTIGLDAAPSGKFVTMPDPLTDEEDSEKGPKALQPPEHLHIV